MHDAELHLITSDAWDDEPRHDDDEGRPRTDESGVHRLPAVDRKLFAQEVLSHRSELVAAGARLSGSRAEAEDLVQEAILRAWVFFDRFQPGTNGRAWMHRILFNTFVNGYRRRRREREILGQVHQNELHAQAARAVEAGLPTERLSDEVEAALKKLHPDFRLVIELVDLDGKSYRDAALLLGCPIGTVMSRLHRARRAMKRELEGYAKEHGLRSAEGADAEREAA